jgi:hypothetical protein
VHEGSASLIATSSVTAEATVERGLNDIRLAVLGIIVGVALTVGFGVPCWWPYRVGAGLVAFGATCGLIRCKWSRHKLMSFVHWLTGA